MIRLDGVSRLFRSTEVETAALRDVNLEIEAGEFVAIMGPSGCGKSTLLNILGAIDRPSSGRHAFNSTDLTSLSERQLARFRSENLGFVFQSFNLIDDLTVAENIELGIAYRSGPRAERRASVERAMDRVGIGHRASHFPHQLSGGQQQRAAIARAIVGAPKLILADEPTGNLDTSNGQQVMDILASLNSAGATIVMVTHSAAHADMAKRQVSMLDGRIVASVARAL